MRSQYKLAVILLSITALGAINFACTSSKENDRAEQTKSLYEKSCCLIREYTDSIASAGDSISVQRYLSNFEDRLTHLNYEYEPDTDIYMTESQNDTLLTLTDHLLSKVDSVYMSFKIKKEPTDSVASSILD